tara:strand:- start:3967 stop:4194 length:228 start_codon:yes stop_codon:yes gene_type:complete
MGIFSFFRKTPKPEELVKAIRATKSELREAKKAFEKEGIAPKVKVNLTKRIQKLRARLSWLDRLRRRYRRGGRAS